MAPMGIVLGLRARDSDTPSGLAAQFPVHPVRRGPSRSGTLREQFLAERDARGTVYRSNSS
jgi:hypothetical protein